MEHFNNHDKLTQYCCNNHDKLIQYYENLIKEVKQASNPENYQDEELMRKHDLSAIAYLENELEIVKSGQRNWQA